MATAAATQHDTNANVPSGDDDTPELSLREQLEQEFDRDEPTDEVSEHEQREQPSAEARRRDEFGRFQRGGKPQAAAPAQTPTEGAAQPQEAQTQPQQGQGSTAPAPGPTDAKDLKPPASWTPQAREEWGALSPRIKQEIHRREYEAQRVVQEGAQNRQFIQAFENIVRPYEMFIRADKSTPLGAVQNLMSTAAGLRMGTPGQKADLVAGIIRNFGIDVAMLDTLLANNLGAGINGPANGMQMQPQQQPQEFRDPRFDAFLAEQERRESADMAQQLASFAQGHEFYHDVAATMADIVEVRSKQGQPIDLEKIYEQACKLDEGVSTILSQRSTAQKSNDRSAAVLRAKRAASSVRTEATPDGATVPRDDSVRASLEAAFENVGRM